MTSTHRIRMKNRPGRQLVANDFVEETIDLPALGNGEVLCKTRYFSLDPYLVGMMRSWEGPDPGWQQGLICGRMVAEVIESRDPDFTAGDWVQGECHWQALEAHKASTLSKLPTDSDIPPSAYLGVLGSSGLTAWLGIEKILQLKAGQTISISSAAGVVGGIAGQLAKHRGARVIGIAGGPEKCASVVSDLGFDTCVDHTSDNFHQQLAEATPKGVDAHFENVGAKILDPILERMRDCGKIALCGLIAHYLDEDPITLKNFRMLLTKGLRLQGFRLFDHFEETEAAHGEILSALRAGTLSLRETITQGLSQAPAAYVAMLSGGGIGKHLIAIND
jgi:NADPH-dependent curcumin reductase CurA